MILCTLIASVLTLWCAVGCWVFIARTKASFQTQLDELREFTEPRRELMDEPTADGEDETDYIDDNLEDGETDGQDLHAAVVAGHARFFGRPL